MKVDRQHLAKLLNGSTSAMFATFREADIPSEIIDGIIANDPKALDRAISYLRSADISDKQRALIANIVSWAINTIGLTVELGMTLEKNEVDPTGHLPRFRKEPPKSFG